MSTQGTFDDFNAVHGHEELDVDMHDLFFLLNNGADTEPCPQPYTLGFPASLETAFSQACCPETACITDAAAIMSSAPCLRIKQEPTDFAGQLDRCESSHGCQSSSGGSPVARDQASGASHLCASDRDVCFAANSSDDSSHAAAAATAPAQPLAQEPAHHLHSGPDSTPAPAAAVSESQPIDVAAPTQSDSTDALYDITYNKSRSYGRGPSKKPPLSHSTIEKHRRDRINHLIEELGEMVPALDPRYRADGAESSGLKRPKHAILADVVARYRQLQAENDSLRRRLAAVTAVTATSATATATTTATTTTGTGSASCAATPTTGAPCAEPPQQALQEQQQPPTAQKIQSPPQHAPPASGAIGTAATTTVVSVDTQLVPPPCTSAPQEAQNPTHAAGPVLALAPAPLVPAAMSPQLGSTVQPATSVAAMDIGQPGSATPSPASPMAVAAATMTSLLAQAVTPGGQLQLPATALSLPLIKAAAAAAAAAAASAPFQGFVPIAVPGSLTFASPLQPTVSMAAGGPLQPNVSMADGTTTACDALATASASLAATPATATANTTAVAAMPSPSLSTMPAAMSPLECFSTPAVLAPASVAAANNTNHSCCSTPITATAAAPAQLPPCCGDVQTNKWAASLAVPCPSDAGSVDPSSTMVHVSPNASAAGLALPSNLAVPTPLAAAPVAAIDAAPQQPGPFTSSGSPSAAAGQDSPLTPPGSSGSASALSAPPPKPSSWLVRVVCPQRKDLVAATCTALTEAGVALRAINVSAAPGGRMALELEVSCEDGVLPRGIQVGHIQCAIHAALQACGPEEEEEEAAARDGVAAAAAAPAAGVTAPRAAGGGRKRARC